ncbi:MAG: class I SAM-dependent methyltransferase, partial [Desulfobulbaceae bacterium]|nr:class I SAM-dependent methyltransferase [Desulfobulbaceae bacterium]
NGRIERELFDVGVALEFDAFDYSDDYLDQARALQGNRPVTYFKSTFETLRLKKQYDLIINVAALHHCACLESLLERLANALQPDGLFVNWDYVGPNRNQYSAEHLHELMAFNNSFPARFMTKHPLQFGIDTFIRGDITEAVRAADVISTFEHFFEVVERRDLGGGIAYQLLWNNVEEFSKNDPEAKALLKQIIDHDRSQTKKRRVPTLFAFFIGSSRAAVTTLAEDANKYYRDRVEAELERQLEENARLSERVRQLEMEMDASMLQRFPVSSQETFFRKVLNFFKLC